MCQSARPFQLRRDPRTRDGTAPAPQPGANPGPLMAAKLTLNDLIMHPLLARLTEGCDWMKSGVSIRSEVL